MFFEKIKSSILKGRSPSGEQSPLRRLPVLFSSLKKLTWVSELKTILKLVAHRQSAPVYGVDIGSAGIKILRLTEGGEGEGLTVEALAEVEIPEEAIVDGEINDREAVVEAIMRAMDENLMEPGFAITGLSGRSVIVKKISMEKTDPDLARETLSYDAAEHIPFEPGEVCLDLHILEGPPEAETMDVLLVAAKRPVVELYSEILTDSGLKPAVVDVGTFAMSNAYLLNYEPSGEENVALVNIGNYVTNMAVIQGSIPWVMRDLAVGTHSFVEKLQEVLSIEKQRSRDILFGSPERGVESRLSEIVAEVGGELVSEIERSLAYADSDGGGGELYRMLLSGGGCRIEGLKDLVAERLKIPVELADPFQKFSWGEALMEAPPEDMAPRFMIAAGLALRGVGV